MLDVLFHTKYSYVAASTLWKRPKNKQHKSYAAKLWCFIHRTASDIHKT
jgi:hypothetical protein